MKILAAIPVYNEEAILKNCLDHYSSFCDKIIVWDNESTDKTREVARSYEKVEVRTFASQGYDEMSVLNVLADSKCEATGVYDWVVLPDADEIVVLKDGSPVRQYLKETDADYVRAAGYCFVHSPDEQKIDTDRPFISQRRYGYACDAYSKPIIFRPSAPIGLQPGKHDVARLSECKELNDKKLALLHYEMIDFDMYVYRKNRRPLSEMNIKYGWSAKRFCRPIEVIAEHWRAAVGKSKDLRSEIPVIADGH